MFHCPAARPFVLVTVAALASPAVAVLPPVQVGDLTQSSAVVTVDGALNVTFEWALAAQPESIVGSAGATAPSSTAPAKLVITGLLPGKDYVVRAKSSGDFSADSAFATLRPNGRPGFRFGVSGDWRGELAPYPAVKNADERALDLFIRLGDTVYADYPSPDVFIPQCIALDEFRLKHREVYSPRFGLDAWGELALVTPSLATIDDHEVTNDFAGGEFTTDPLYRAVPASLETPQLLDNERGGDADADDPAIWTHPTDPAMSRVLCVAKNGGLRVYDLSGNLVQTVAPDAIRYNNVDLITGFELNGTAVDIAVVSDRLNDLMVFFKIDAATGTVINVTDPTLPRVFPKQDVKEQETVYGVGTVTRDDGRHYAFVSRRSTSVVRQLEIIANGSTVAWTPVRDIVLPAEFDGWVPENPQVEGIVVDAFHDVAYVGQEQVGFWKLSADPASVDAPVLVDRVRDFGGILGPGTWLSADVEGLTIADFGAGAGDLIVSSQGDSTFAIYDRVTNAKVGRFAIGGGAIDAVEECDGAAVSTNTFGGIWPGGLLVVQDGNDLPSVLGEDDGEIENVARSFKYVSYADARAAATAPAIRVNESPLYVAGITAFEEWNPLDPVVWQGTGDPRMDGRPKLYRAQAHGKDAAVFMLDARSFRDESLPSANPADPTSVFMFLIEAFNPKRTMLGKPQVEQLKSDLLAAQAAGITWKFVLVPEPIQNLGVVAAGDRFEGYAAERTEILAFVDETNIENVVFIAADIHGTLVNNLKYQIGVGEPQIPTDAWEISTGSVAFDAPFGPTVLGLAFALGLISESEYAQYLAAPTFVQDAIVTGLVNSQLSALGYDLLGFEGSTIPASFTVGGPVATHVFGWTEFDIAPGSKRLVVTTYGIDPYTSADLLADPVAVVARIPQIVSQFEVDAVGVPCVGDVDGSGSVNAADLGALLGAWGSQDSAFDLDGSGDVEGGDLAVLLATWGICD
ncbi:MAG: phytase [Phycisphaerae bacterium]|nr:phytase [Phycisphaerae bacterium]